MIENKGSVAMMITVSGNNSMLTSKLHFLLNILAQDYLFYLVTSTSIISALYPSFPNFSNEPFLNRTNSVNSSF